MERDVYLANPCKASSLPFWKTNLVEIPENMKIVLEKDLQSMACGFSDEEIWHVMRK